MTLFRYLQDKDMFEAFYKKNLAKRLLLGMCCVRVCSCGYGLCVVLARLSCGRRFVCWVIHVFMQWLLPREAGLHSSMSGYLLVTVLLGFTDVAACSNHSYNRQVGELRRREEHALQTQNGT
jgi:hypothetical protein